MKRFVNCVRDLSLLLFFVTFCSTDAVDDKSVKPVPFVFTESKCSDNGCSFTNKMLLRCNYKSDQCKCDIEPLGGARDSYWDTKSYDGNNNCSVGKFGPCGTRNGITIGCHGAGISCVDGNCSDANHLVSEIGEACASTENCRDGLLCSYGYVCIRPFSLSDEEICTADNECQEGLQCKYGRFGPWRYCRTITYESD